MNVGSLTVLCYGDSNTWGQTPDKTGRRWSSDVRWTGVLQQQLGEEFRVIEEGLSSRTTNLDYDKKPGRNGLTYLEPCLDSHAPLDFVVLMLGTNDYKIEFNRSAAETAAVLKDLVRVIQKKTAQYDGRAAKIILVSPIHVDGDAPMIKEWYSKNYDQSSVDKSRELAILLKSIADDLECVFVDAAMVAKAGQDGIHFDQESHRDFAEYLAKQILFNAKL